MGQRVCGAKKACQCWSHSPPSGPHSHSKILAFLPKWPPAEQVQASSQVCGPGPAEEWPSGVAQGGGVGSLDVRVSDHLQGSPDVGRSQE